MNILGQRITESGDITFFGNIETTEDLIIKKINVIDTIEVIEEIQIIEKKQREVLKSRIEELEKKVEFLLDVIENLTELIP